MHRSYYLFYKQIKALRNELPSRRITDIYTWRKNELVINLDNEVQLAAGIGIDLPYLLKMNISNPQKNRLSLFESCVGQAIHDIVMPGMDKQVRIILDENNIEIVFYGRQNNVFLCNLQGQILDSFKQKYQKEPLTFRDSENFDELRIKGLKGLLSSDQERTTASVLRESLAINNRFMSEFLFRSGLDASILDTTPQDQKLDPLDQSLSEIWKELDHAGAYLYSKDGQILTISPFSLRHLKVTKKIEEQEIPDINEGWKRFILNIGYRREYEKLLTSCRKILGQRIEFLEKTLKKIAMNEDLNRRKKEAELKGNLLLTHKSEIQDGLSEVVLTNIFSDTSEKIAIKLNPGRSVVDNANRYFNKYKNLAPMRIALDIKKSSYQQELAETVKLRAKLTSDIALPKLKRLYTELSERGLIQEQNEKKAGSTPFRRFILDGGWQVLIGRNALDNERLTFQFANKWDYWFHAQGASGSHVILRLPNRQSQPPPAIIEQTAQLAAGHSKAKNSGTVAVIYTPVRYVQRVRKGPPGMVKTSNAKTLFVSPLALT